MKGENVFKALETLKNELSPDIQFNIIKAHVIKNNDFLIDISELRTFKFNKMKVNVLVVNTEIIQGEDLSAIVQLAKEDYQCAKLQSFNHYLLCAVHDDDVDDLYNELEDLNLSNPAYEITVRDINSQAELEALSLVLQLEPR